MEEEDVEEKTLDVTWHLRLVESFKVKTDTELDCILNPTLFSVFIHNFMEQSNMYYTFHCCFVAFA